MLPSLRAPTAESIAHLRKASSQWPFADAVGQLAQGKRPPGFVEDHNRREIGSGKDAFERAKAAITSWRMFDFDWIHVEPADAPIAEGSTVAIVAKTYKVWTASPARIFAIIDQHEGDQERFGFTYGSLPGHAEQGIESFCVEYNHADQSAWYDLHSFSRPGRWFTSLTPWLTRRVQARFARDSMGAMERAVAEPGTQ